MTPIGIFTEGLQVLSSWLMSVLALLALLVSVIFCLIIVEVIFERGALARAYTVKTNPSHVSSNRIET
jgi:fatty-acid desaturase